MAEYIDRFALIDAMQSYQYDAGKDGFAIMALIGIQPAADVAQVVHGCFVHKGPRFAGGVDWWRCSNCGGLASGHETRFNYCPHCGARMDGGAEDG